MNYTSDAQEDASKIGAVKAIIQRIIALPITPAGRGGVQTPCSGCWGDTSGVCQSEGNQVCYDLVQGDCPAGTKPCEASPLVPVPPPPPMEQCTGCWGLTEGVCQGADDVCYPLLRGQCPSGTKPCEATSLLPNPSPAPPIEQCTGCFGETKGYPLIRGHACPPGAFPCGSLPPLDPNKDDDKATIEDLANYQDAFRAEMEWMQAATDAINAAGDTVAELPDVPRNQHLRTYRGYYMKNHVCDELGDVYDAAACSHLPLCSTCEADYDPISTGTACNGRPCEDKCSCGVCGSYGGCSASVSCKAKTQFKRFACRMEEPPKCEDCVATFGSGPSDCGGHPCDDACGCGVCGSYGMCSPSFTCSVNPHFGRHQCIVPTGPPPPPPSCSTCESDHMNDWKLIGDDIGDGATYDKTELCGNGQSCEDKCDCGVCGSYGGCGSSCSPFPYRRFACCRDGDPCEPATRPLPSPPPPSSRRDALTALLLLNAAALPGASAQAVQVTGPIRPPSPPQPCTSNQVQQSAPDVGAWGGTCTCPRRWRLPGR